VDDDTDDTRNTGSAATSGNAATSGSPTRPDAAELLALAVEVTTAAARLAATRRAEGVEVADTKSSVVDVVTHTDREVETFLRERLAELRPGDGFSTRSTAP
jgi:myo-inositol-1(or 4)-monophosphatase